MLNLGPCSMLPPHYHPRASNYVVAVHGKTTTYMYEENGAELVTEELSPGQATIFPQGVYLPDSAFVKSCWLIRHRFHAHDGQQR